MIKKCLRCRDVRRNRWYDVGCRKAPLLSRLVLKPREGRWGTKKYPLSNLDVGKIGLTNTTPERNELLDKAAVKMS